MMADTMYRYMVVIENAGDNYSAYSPDLPGCIATGNSHEEVTRNMQEAIELHIQGMIADQEPSPTPRTFAEYITVPIE